VRALVALLLLANLAFFALARGWLQPYVGLSTQHQREPQRLAAQLNAESVRVRAVGAAASAPAAPGCVQAGPFSSEQLDAVQATLTPAQRAATSRQRWPEDGSGNERAALFALRAEQPDAALLQSLRALAAEVPGAGVAACAAPR